MELALPTLALSHREKDSCRPWVSHWGGYPWLFVERWGIGYWNMSKGIVDNGEYKSTIVLRRQCDRCLLCTLFHPEDGVRVAKHNSSRGSGFVGNADAVVGVSVDIDGARS